MPRPAPPSNPAWRDLPVRQFVPVGSEPAPGSALDPAQHLEVPLAAVDPEPWDARVSLFGDLDR